MLAVTVVIVVELFVYNKIFKKNKLSLDKGKKTIFKVMIIATFTFYTIAIIGSPWRVLRYIVPVCGLIFALISYLIYKLLETAFGEKLSNILITIFFCLILISPHMLGLVPELMYNGRHEILEKLSKELNNPAIYIADGHSVSFLDEILLFNELDESYIMQDTDYSKEKFQEILKGEDTKNGIIVFISEKQDESILETIKIAINLENIEHLQKLNSYNVYYIK